MPKDVEIQRRLAISRVPINKQDAATRVGNWDEVFLGFDLESAKIEAARCLQCPTAPCQQACPVENDIPGAFKLLEVGDVAGAANVFRETSNLPELCGRLCPQERLCEGECVVAFAIRPDSHQEPPVAIGKLEAFAADYQREHLGGVPLPVIDAPSGFKVAVVGAGPAGLAVAEDLAKDGHDCTIYDAWPEPGGVLLYGIPNFKLSKRILDDKLEYLRKLNVKFVGNTWVGKDVTVDQLFDQGFDAVFIGTGASLGGKLAIPGEEMSGIYSATEFLVRGNLRPEQLPEHMREPLTVGDDVVVIGGGDTSMDCVRTAIRLGAQNVTCVYRRTETEMLGREEERRHAKEEGVRFLFQTIPLRFIGEDGKVTGLECQKMALGEPDESGRRRPIPIPHSEYVIPCETSAIAIGYNADPIIKDAAPGVQTNRWNLVEIDHDTGMTTRPGVFAGGDNVNGADLVVTALADGRRASRAIHEYLQTLPAKAIRR